MSTKFPRKKFPIAMFPSYKIPKCKKIPRLQNAQ